MAEAVPRDEVIELRTGKIHYLQGGDGDPLLVFHHSTGNPGWIPFYEELARRFSVTVLDLPGYGQSERPEWARHPRDIAMLASRAADALGLQGVHLLGLGFGGFIAAEAVAMNPDRFATLSLVGAAGLRPERGEILDQMMVSHREYFRLGFRDGETHDATVGAEVDPELRQLWDSSREMTARVCWKPYMFDRRLPHLLQDVHVPALLVWGSEDRIVPPVCGEQYARVLPDATLRIVKGAGHLVEFEDPIGLAELIGEHARKALRSSA